MTIEKIAKLYKPIHKLQVKLSKKLLYCRECWYRPACGYNMRCYDDNRKTSLSNLWEENRHV